MIPSRVTSAAAASTAIRFRIGDGVSFCCSRKHAFDSLWFEESPLRDRLAHWIELFG